MKNYEKPELAVIEIDLRSPILDHSIFIPDDDYVPGTPGIEGDRVDSLVF